MAGTRVQSAMVGKAQQLCEAAGSHSSAVGRRRDESWCQLAFFCFPGPVLGMVPPTFRVCLPCSVNTLWKLSETQNQSYVS